jgi:hypothetical protein
MSPRIGRNSFQRQRGDAVKFFSTVVGISAGIVQ